MLDDLFSISLGSLSRLTVVRKRYSGVLLPCRFFVNLGLLVTSTECQEFPDVSLLSSMQIDG